ncbi:MAG: hypothetical protein ACREPM_23160 [Gemmatimonadaceae bacterium]
MTHQAALPFTLRRSKDVIAGSEVTSTRETVHGLIRLDADGVVIQWRTSRAINRVGAEIRTDRELEPVRELSLPLSALAGAEVRRSWLRWPPVRYLVLIGADLRAFEELAGMEGLQLKHPAQFEIRIDNDSRFAALEFASELKLALADVALRAAETEQLQDQATQRRSLEEPKSS